jgi:hypothetical protein
MRAPKSPGRNSWEHGLDKCRCSEIHSPPGEIVAIRHVFDSTTGADLWLGVGQRKKMHEGDDLVICVGPPVNAEELQLVETISVE